MTLILTVLPLTSMRLLIVPWVQKNMRSFENTQKTAYLPTLHKCLTCWKLIFNTDDFSLVVRTASLANSMRHHQGTALAALYQIWSAHLPVCSTAVSSSFRRFILWTDRHGLHLLRLFKNILDNWHPWVKWPIIAVTSLMVEICATSITDSLTVIAAENRHRQVQG